MINPDYLIIDTINKWQEHLEMVPDQEWQMIAKLISHQLAKQLDETEYYKRLYHASISAKH